MEDQGEKEEMVPRVGVCLWAAVREDVGGLVDVIKCGCSEDSLENAIYMALPGDPQRDQ